MRNLDDQVDQTNTTEEVTPPSGEDFARASRQLRGEDEPQVAADSNWSGDANLTDVTLTIVLIPGELDDPSITRLDQGWLDRWDGKHSEAAFDGTYEEALSISTCLTDFFNISVSMVRHEDYDVGVLGGPATTLDVVDFVPGVGTSGDEELPESMEDFDDGRG